MSKEDILIIGSATASAGMPDDMQNGIIQVIVGIVAWGLTKLFDRLTKKKK